jgi:hypothetical protein
MALEPVADGHVTACPVRPFAPVGAAAGTGAADEEGRS